MKLMRVEGEESLRELKCRNGLTLVVFHDPECPVCRVYLELLRLDAGRLAGYDVVLAEASVYSVIDEVLRLDLRAVPAIAVYYGCRLLSLNYGPLSVDEMAELLEGLGKD